MTYFRRWNYDFPKKEFSIFRYFGFFRLMVWCIIVAGGEIVDIIKTVAKEYGEKPEVVRAEMEAALRAAGIDIEVESFVKMIAGMIATKEAEE